MQSVDLKEIPTCELVRELEKREGVAVTEVEPYVITTATTEGPAIILIVTD